MASRAYRRSVSEVLPLLPLRGILVFPGMVTPLDVGRERSIAAIEAAMLSERTLLLAAQKDAAENEPTPEGIYRVGVLSRIKQLLRLPAGQVRILVEGVRRVEVVDVLQEQPFYQVVVTPLPEVQGAPGEHATLVQSLTRQFERYVKSGRKLPEEVLLSVSQIDDPARLVDVIAAQLPLPLEEKQELLETVEVGRRLERVLEILARELEIVELEKKIHVKVKRAMERSQREFYLREQMKAIQQELGDTDDRKAEVEELKKKIDEAGMPEEARKKALHELGRYEKMPPVVAEAAVIRTYLDWLVELPWSRMTEDKTDLTEAERILNEDHYGLDEVKERILEFLAVRQLSSHLRGPILCLVGPPGVGKTSLAASVARTLGRKFVRFSLGGVRDEAEIRGHRRTYVGAMPGRILQSIRRAGTKNPVLLLDEVDKMTYDFRGDPAAALLEVLDPEQNHAFGDHYLEVPFDLSHVLFITTANVRSNIPRPLLDRMEVISIPGYTEDEKKEIARRHLIPKQLEQHGLSSGQLQISANVIYEIIQHYTREAGVRQLDREISRICRKAARAVIAGRKSTRVTVRNLPRYLGRPRFRYSRREEQDLVGVATGLAYTEAGGDVLPVEVTVVKGKGQLYLTGKLGEVMRESAQAAFSYVRSRANALGIPPNFAEQVDIHIHVPEGAVPKDGPSAGITIATALASALSGRAVRRDVAMTGEITLRGRVLPIGGVKEKLLAAVRSGVLTVLLPKENEKDLEDVPDETRQRVEVVLVEHMDRVLERALLPVTGAGVSPPGEPEELSGQVPFVPRTDEPGDQPWTAAGCA